MKSPKELMYGATPCEELRQALMEVDETERRVNYPFPTGHSYYQKQGKTWSELSQKPFGTL